jgi:5-aminolevulinate synthase
MFEASFLKLREAGRSRTSIELERNVGTFPTAVWRRPDGSRRPVMFWCGDDYLGMGHSPEVLGAMHAALDRCGAGAGVSRSTTPPSRAGRAPAHHPDAPPY